MIGFIIGFCHLDDVPTPTNGFCHYGKPETKQ